MRASLILFLGTLLFCLGGAEFVARGFVPVQPQITVGDAHTRFRLRENLDVTASSPGEFSTHYQTDAAGFRIGSRGTEARDAAKSGLILGVGDSFTFGIGVDFADTFLAVAGRASQHFAVKNAGVLAWGTCHELRYLESRGWALRPAHLVVGVFENDFEDNRDCGLYRWEAGKLVTQAGGGAPPRRWERLRGNPVYRWLTEKSALLAFLRIQVTMRLGPDRSEEGSPDLAHDRALTEALLAEIVAGAESRRIPYTLVVIPSKETVAASLTEGRGLTDKHWKRNALLGMCQRRKWSCLDPLPSFQRAARGGLDLYFAKDSHLSAMGHRVLGVALARRFHENEVVARSLFERVNVSLQGNP